MGAGRGEDQAVGHGKSALQAQNGRFRRQRCRHRRHVSAPDTADSISGLRRDGSVFALFAGAGVGRRASRPQGEPQ
jgi:hypothetical protein